MISRRDLAWAALVPVVAAADEAPRATFVLVPGAWHGAWAFRAVERMLVAKGHTVFCVSLTGLADRAHLLSENVGLSTHVDDVAKLIEVEELTNVTLVGHSYAGMVITGAAAKVASRVHRLVYLDAFVPTSGQSMLALMNPKFSASWRARAEKDGAGWRVPPMLNAKSMGISDAKEAARVDKKLTPQSLKTFDEAVTFDAKAIASIPKTYLRCAEYAGFGPTATKAKAQGFDVRELAAGHDVMVSAPELLSEALLALG